MEKKIVLLALILVGMPNACAKQLPEMVRNYAEIRKEVEREIDPYFPNICDTKEQIEHRDFSIRFMQFLLEQCLKSRQCAFQLMSTSLQGQLKGFVVDHVTKEVVERMRRNRDIVDDGTVREMVLK